MIPLIYPLADDDHAGVFSFEHDHYQVVENSGHLNLRSEPINLFPYLYLHYQN
jgi:hypothetical protein